MARLVAGLILVVSSPLLVLITLTILVCDGRPVLFIQTRVGKNQKRFRIYKFRTMVKGAGPRIVADNSDPRITWIGRWLRKTSLDEIPQFYNILKGDMTLIGPRPLLPGTRHEEYHQSQIFEERYTVSPGITGVGQIVHRALYKKRRALLDHITIKHRNSFRFTLWIIYKTICKMVGAKNL